jgi:hypothetical protein
VKGPAGTLSALATVTFGIETAFSDSHVAASAVAEKDEKATTAKMANDFRLMMHLPLGRTGPGLFP